MQAHNVATVVRVPLLVELLQNCDLSPRLLEVGGVVFDHLDCDNVVSAHVLALDHLAKCALAKHVEDEVSVTIGWTQPVVDVEDKVVALVVPPLVVSWLGGLGKHATGIALELVEECWVDQVVRVV